MRGTSTYILFGLVMLDFRPSVVAGEQHPLRRETASERACSEEARDMSMVQSSIKEG